MALYKISTEKFELIKRTSYVVEKMHERYDLQRLLSADISPIGDDLMVIAAEFGNWEDSKRRIDLLCLSKKSDLVVVEIKRTEDGGHMELQAVRYAAMISSMTMDQLVSEYARAKKFGVDVARNQIAQHLEQGGESELALSGKTRIVLVSEDFSTEVTTAVLWLNKHDLAITCVRLRPHRLGNDVIVDATQIIPLPEAADYEVRMRAKEAEERQGAQNRETIFRRFWAMFIERSLTRSSLLEQRREGSSDHVLRHRIGRSGVAINVVLEQQVSRVELYLSIAGDELRTRAAFQQVAARRLEIENQFGAPLVWEQEDGRIACRIYTEFAGGWKSPESEWTELHDRLFDGLQRVERIMAPLVLSLTT